VWVFVVVDVRPTWAEPAPTATETLAKLRKDYETHFNWGIVYWAVAGGLVVTAAALIPPTTETEGGRLSLVSGTATLLSGVSSGVSAAPLFLAPGHLAAVIEAHGGEAVLKDEAVARRILEEHATWARHWRVATLVVTTTLLAANCALLSTFAAKNTYERTSVGVVAGLYGLGVAVVPWYDSLPWPEETMAAALQSGSASKPAASIYIRPSVAPTQEGFAFSLAVGGPW
jgi:hypothetical protein